jgi:GntR family transcriptional regulator/MocR family aminotransferase
MVAPASLRSALCTAKRLTDWQVEPTTQGALADFIDDGLFARHLRKASREYAARHELIAETLRRDFGGLLEPVPAAAGLHLCAKTAPGVDPEAVLAAALRAGVRVESLAGYAARPERAVQGMVVGYGLIGRDQIPEGLRRLAEAF